MNDEHKTQEKLLSELMELRQRLAELEASETRCQRAEEALRGSEERLRNLIETMAEGVILVAPDGQIVQANPAAQRILGLKRSQIEGRNYVGPGWKILRPDRTPMPPEEMAGPRAMKEKRLVKDVIMGVKRPDGSISWLNVSAAPLINEAGDLEGIVGTFADITERVQAEERVQRLLRQQIAVNQLALALGESRDLDKIYHTIYEHVGALMDANAFIISFYDKARRLIHAAYVVAEGVVLDAASLPPIPLEEDGHGTQSEVIRTGQPLYVPDLRQAMEKTRTEHTILKDGKVVEGSPPLEEEISRSALYAPMKIEGETIGVMQVQSYRLDAYSQEDMNLLSALANQAAIAIHNARLVEKAHSRAERLAVINRIARAAGATLHLDDLMETVYREIASIFQADAFFIALYDEEADELDFRLRVDEGVREPRERRPVGTGLTSLVVSEKKPLLIRDFEEERDHLPTPGVWGTMKVPASWLGVPMMIGERLVGVICVQAYRPQVYGEEEQLLLFTIADQVAVAVENARLYEETRRRAEEMTALRQVSLATLSALERDQVFEIMLDQLGTVIDYDAAAIKVITPDGKDKMMAGRGPVIYDQAMWNGFDVKDNKLVQEMKETRQPVAVHDTHTDERYKRVGNWQVFRSWVGAPLFVKDELIGYLAVEKTSPGFYDETAVQLLGDFARAAAIAIENARLFEETRRRSEELATLNAIATAVSQSLDLKEILGAALEETLAVLNVEGGVIYLFDETSQTFAPAIHHGISQDVLREVSGFKMGEGLSGRVAESGEALVMADLGADPRNISPASTREGWHSYAGVPIKSRGKVSGVMTLVTYQEGYFTSDHLDLLSHIGNQIGVTIENARLYEAEREQRDLAEALEEAAAAVSSTLDAEQVLDRILEQVSRVVPNDATNIMLIEGDQARVVRWRGYERFGAEEFVSTVTFRIPEVPGLQQMLDSGEPMVIPDTAAYPGWVRLPVTEWLRSYAAAPIVVRGEVIGFLNMDSATPGFFTQAHAEALRAFGDHAAAAIENARLYEAEQRRRQDAEALRQTTLALTSALDRNQVIGRILSQLQQVVPYDSASVQLLQSDRLVIIGGRGFPNLEEILGLSFPVDGHNPNREVMRTLSPFILEDAPAVYEEFRKEPHAPRGIRSWLGVPMLIGKRPVGMISLDKCQPDFYNEEHARLAQAFAAQAAIAIENARLYDETVERAESLSALYEIGKKINSTLELDRILEVICDEAMRATGAVSADVSLVDFEQGIWEMRAVRGYAEDWKGRTFSLDTGITGRVLRTGESAIIPDVSQEEEYILSTPELRSELTVPIFSEGKVVGAVNLESTELSAFDEDDLRFVQTLADQAAMAIKNARLFEETRRHHEEMAALNAIGQDITSSLDLDETLQRIVDSTRWLTGARRSRILLINPRARQVLRDVISGYPPEERGTYDYERFEQGISGWVVREKRSTLVPDVLADERSVGQSRAASIRHDTKSVAVAPLMVRGEVIGTLSAVNLREDPVFTPQGMALVEQLAAQAAIAIENARLFEKTEHLKAFNESIVQGVAEAILIEDAQGLFTFANLAAEELLGYTREEFIGRHWTTIVPEEQVENVRQELAKRPQGIESRYETVLLSKEGQRIPVIVSARPLLKGGQFVGVLSAFTDITERVRAEEALRESEERYRHIFDQSPIGIGIASFDGKIVAASKAMQVMTGYSLEELKKIDLARTYENPEDRKALLEAIGQYGSVADFPVRLKRKDGAPYDALLTVSRINLGGKDLLHTICQDITERKRAEREIEERRVYLEGVLGAAPDAIVSVDARYRIVEWNRGAERLFGYSREEAIGQDLDHLVANPDTFEEAIGFTKMVMNGKELPPTETVRYRKDGSPVDVIVAGSPIRVEGEFIGAVAVYTDITARVRMEEALLALALVDELTGLYNRRGFVTLAEQQLKMANRMRRKMVLLFADFDGLKQINDAFGHPEGDRALIEVAHIFRETFRESDIMARLGGDEFVVLAVETDRASAEVLATRLRESLEARNAKADRRYKLSLSVGVARYDPEHPCSMDELLVRADRVMYERKGCNQNS